MEERIKKWEEEIEKIAERQKEINAKSNERIRELRKKIQEAEEEMERKNNRLIAEAVREIYGEIDGDSIEEFKRKIQSVYPKKPEEFPQQENETVRV